MSDNQGLYRDFHKIDLSHLKALLHEGSIDAQVAENLVQYWQKRLDDKSDAIYSRYIEYYLFFESLRALFLAVFIFDMKTGISGHSYGIYPALGPAIHGAISAALQNDSGAVDFELGGKKYALHYLRSGYQEQEYAIAALGLKDQPIAENLKRLKYVFERFYLPSSFSSDSRVALLFTDTANLISEMINPALARKEPVTFTYLYFESLTKYVGLAGENFAQTLLEELQKDVHRVLKDTDRSLILSTREILIVSLNCEEEVMKKRFAGAYFHAKSLLLSFQVNFHTIKAPVVDVHSLWDGITGNVAYKRKIS